MTQPAPQLSAPPQLVEEIFDALEAKSELPLRPMVILGILAGIFIGLGGLFATVVLAGADALPHGIGQLAAGLVFSVGLALVVIAGAELFTGNILFAGPVSTGQLTLGRAVRALSVVYCANFVGAVLLATLVVAARLHEVGDGAVAQAALSLAAGKTGNAFMASFASGILANMLVCLAVWLAYAGNTVTQKIAGLILPVACFVAAGLEHSVANMYLLPYAWMVEMMQNDAAGHLSVVSILQNLVPATLGNIVGGVLIALAYRYAYRQEVQPRS